MTYFWPTPSAFLLLLFLMLPHTLYGQNAETRSIVLWAIQTIESGEGASAIDPLEEAFEQDPAWYEADHASIAYWLGRAYYEEGHVEDAREVWLLGLESLTDANRFDSRLAITLLTAIFELHWEEDYPLGASLYMNTLLVFDASTQPDALSAFQTYFNALTFVLPASLKDELDISDRQSLDSFSWTSYTGSTLATWWRSQDPAPATRINELLVEHLERIAYAHATYSYEGTIDDRGAVYIRLGPPSSTTRVNFDHTNFRNKVLDRSLTINESDFPDNEFWYYDHIDNVAHFLFHDKFGPFKTGDVMDLIPSSIRSGLGASARGRVKARFLVKTLEEIYRQLSLYHEAYSLRYQEVASFSSLLDEAEVAAETAAIAQQDQEQVDTEEDANLRDLLANNRGNSFAEVGLPGSSFSPGRPDLYVQSVMANDRASDEMQRALREQYVPQNRSNVFDETAPLPLFIRSARFLDTDGTTRTEVYWAAPPGALAVDDQTLSEVLDLGYNPDDYLIVTSSVQKNPDYTERRVNHQRQLIENAALAENLSLVPQTLTVQGDTGLYHIAIQWDQVVTILDEAGTPVDLGPRIKANVFRQDSLRALNNQSLEMSDLKPMTLMDAGQGREETIVYPASSITNDRPVILHFELYNLTFAGNDRTNYSIEYTIEEIGSKSLRIGRRRNASTSFKSTEEGTERNTPEQLVLDLSEWRGKGDIRITVTVTDENNRLLVSRSIEYTLTS